MENILENGIFNPMSPDHFKIAVSRMLRLDDKNLIAACRQVLVDEEKNGDVAEERGITPTHLSKTCHNIVNKWRDVSEEGGLVTREFALQPHEIVAVENLEAHNLEFLTKKK